MTLVLLRVWALALLNEILALPIDLAFRAALAVGTRIDATFSPFTSASDLPAKLAFLVVFNVLIKDLRSLGLNVELELRGY